MTCIGYVTGFGLRSQDRQEASPILPDFSLVPANVLEVFGPPSLANLRFRARPEWRGGCEPVRVSDGPHTPESPLFDLIAQSSFNPDVLGKHTQVNLCLLRQAWQQKPLRKGHCLVP